MSLAVGSRVGPFEISARIGAGGMGEVYQATDTTLGRDVAIKVLPDAVAHDADRLARFDREAKVLAALNHPNIAAIYGLERSSGITALVMELVGGDTLADRLVHGALPVQETLSLSRQIAEALEAAHEKGVIHRDLKPSNIKVTPDGQIKVLDFGLAKALDGPRADANLTYSPTLSIAATQQGVILGTAAYMSPEQAKGRAADRRADIFAFGSVLFEMLTGQQAFRGELATEIMASVINQEPDYSKLPLSVPPRLNALLRRCLKKDPRQRWQAAGDLRVELEEILREPATTRDVATPPRRRVWLPWAVAAIGIVASGASAWDLKPSASMPVTKFPIDLVGAPPILDAIAISPDGQRIVYGADGKLYVRALDQMTSVPIPGTEDGVAPFFSPDGTRLAFSTPTQVKSVDLRGGLPVILTALEVPALQGVWHESGRLIFGQAGSFGLSSVPESGGALTPFAALGKSLDVDYPDALPGGEWILFTELTTQPNWNDASIVAHSIKTGERKTLIKAGYYARYVPTGHLVFARGGNLYAVRFDVKSLSVIGNPVLMVEHVMMVGFIAGQAQFAIAANGTLVYRPGTFGQNDLALVNNRGDVKHLNLPARTYANPGLSPDGSQIAVQSFDDSGNDRIWVYSLSGNTQMRELVANARSPVWTRDNQRITFDGTRDGVRGVYWENADGTTTPELLFKSSDDKAWQPESWSPDGRVLLVAAGTMSGAIATFTPGKDKEPQPLPRSDGYPGGPVFSPDGKWIAYHRQTGAGPNTYAVHVQPFPPTSAEYRVSADTRVFPIWRPGTNEIVYVTGLIGDELNLAATSVTTTGAFSAGQERILPTKVSGQVLQRTFDVNRDGLVIVVPSQTNAHPQLNIVLNWFDELRTRVPVQ